MRLNGNARNTAHNRATFTDSEMRALEKCASIRAEELGFGSIKSHIMGVLGEAATLRVLSMPIQVCIQNDNGVDFLLGNIEVDAKTTYVQNGGLLFKDYDKFSADIAVLAHPVGKDDPNSVDVIGWTTQEKFVSEANWKAMNNGVPDRLILAREKLFPMETLTRVLDGEFCERYSGEEKPELESVAMLPV
jgi:hypothetical protein